MSIRIIGNEVFIEGIGNAGRIEDVKDNYPQYAAEIDALIAAQQPPPEPPQGE